MTRRTLRPALLAAALLAPASADAQPAGVTLHEGVWLAGERITLTRDTFDLNDTPFGARRTSSVDVSRGCRAILFELSGYRGRSVELTARDNDLGNTRLGRSSVGSVRVDCGGGSGGGWGTGGPGGGSHERGATLYRDRDLAGPAQTFDRDVPDLERTRIGGRRASSIFVSSGCVATLFSEPDYRGRSTTFREADNNLKNTPVGEDSAQSLRVDCGGRPESGRPPARPVPSDGVTLFRDRSLKGPSESFRSDVPDLARTGLGARTASSILVPEGCRATLFSETGFRGRSTTFDESDNNLKNTPVGEDSAQSLRVVCDRRR